ncbi:MAG: hypothetical protein GY737_15175, partial [Desulfobacteraceae bacterium]|nr:hypothetical protein [Desulfobacteraceae bacterium]
MGHIQRNCHKSSVQGEAKSAVKEPTEAEMWEQFISGWNSCCKSVVFNISESSQQGSSTAMATRRVPRLPIEIDGVHLSFSALPDSGASMSVLVPSSLIPVIYKGRLFHVYQNLRHVPSTPIRQVEGQPLHILGSLLTMVTMCGQQISTPIYICPGMAASNGIIVGCHSLWRLGFSLCRPDGIDYLSTSDSADNLELNKLTSFPAPKGMPFQGEEREEEASVQIQPTGRDSQVCEEGASSQTRPMGWDSLGQQATTQTQSSKAGVVRKKKKKSKKKLKGQSPDRV